MRVMKVFQIEKNYQQHKKRLSSINSLSSKEKVNLSTHNHVDKINNFKKNKVHSELFVQDEKGKKIFRDNCKLHQTLSKVYSRCPQSSKKLERTSSKQSMRSSASRSMKNRQLKHENEKMTKKIENTSSYYTAIRKNMKNKREHRTKKDQLIKMLEGQLRLKPQVVFPSVKKKRSPLFESQNKI